MIPTGISQNFICKKLTFVNCTGLNFGGKWKTTWANNDLELELVNSLLSLNDLITPASIKKLKYQHHELKHIRAVAGSPDGN